ncbi:MAG TPA: protein kinase [Vicinamibacteria bacterium]
MMEPQDWERIKTLFQTVLDRDPDQRSAYLSEICEDARLRAEVEDLIACHEQAGAVLGTSDLGAPAPSEKAEFAGTERFQLERRLGSGAFGVVYRAYDRKRNRVVALKTLASSNSEALYRLKREFRGLADLSHPNLVRLHELVSEGPVWFFTMELVDGVTFLDFVRPSDAGRSAGLDESRLRPALWQLAEGVLALHQARRLHRDLKPSNVLVSNDGRVQILDFGLVADLSLAGGGQSSRIVGTPAYMSPEQGTREPLTEASDWYSVGMMLYEALTGRLPFRGGFVDIMMQKRSGAPPVPSAVMPEGAPADLDELCRDLLQPDPSKRPSGREVLQRLRPPSAPPMAPVSAIRTGSPFVGRQKELAELRRAFAAARGGATAAVAVHGTSGIGKSALVRFFLDELAREAPGTAIFRARCYEQESVPYKALDGIVDSLAAYLRRLSPSEAEGVLPRDVLALARLFPVLKHVPAVASVRRRVLQVIDSQELRRRAFGALRELLARIGEHNALVLFIDDLQWGDLDSAALLVELLRPPDPPSLLLIGSYRTEEAQTSPFLSHVLPLRAQLGPALDVRELPLTEMEPARANELALLLLGIDSPDSASQAAAIARESGGNPFLLDELARHARTGRGMRDGDASAAAGPSGRLADLDEVVHARVSELPGPARQILEAVCVAGQPIDEMLAGRVAGLQDPEPALVDLLKQDRFVRTRVVSGVTMLEAYHDRIREAVVRRIPPATGSAYHGALARELERSAQSDPETLALHFEAAGEPGRAADYAVRAAERASESLAFEHAAQLYGSVLRLRPAQLDLHRVRIRLGDCLASAGRGSEAAAHYLEASESARGVEAQELRRRAAEQLLTSGRIQPGLEVMETLLKAVGMGMPASRGRAIASLLWNRALLRLRGTRVRLRAEADIAAERLVRVDTCWSATIGLMFVHPLISRMFQSQHILLALSAGEPYRVARALAIEGGFTAAEGLKARRRNDALLQQARAISAQIAKPHAVAFITLAEGFLGYFEGRWTRALELLDASESMFRERCTGVAWEIHTSQLYSLRCLYYLGRARDIDRRLKPLLDDVRHRGDLFFEAALATLFQTFLAIARDDPDQAREKLERLSEIGLHERFTLQRFWDLESRVLLAHYLGEGSKAYETLRDRMKEYEQSGLDRIQHNRIVTRFWRGRSALAAASAADARTRPGLLREAAAHADAIQKERTIWGDGFSNLLRAGLALAADARDSAVQHLKASQTAFEAADVVGVAAMAARLRCGELTGGAEGQAMVDEAEGWLTDQGFARPDRFAAVYVPEVGMD